MGNLWKELRRRNMFRVTGLYAVVGWLLVQIAAVLEAAIALPHWFDGFIVALMLIAFPVVLIMAWAFELTPEGIKRTEAVKPGESVAPRTGRFLDYFILAGLVLVAVIIVLQMTVKREGSSQPEVVEEQGVPDGVSIAVLPFINRSLEPGDAYFTDGVHDELLTQLSKIASFNVISRTSVMSYRDEPKPIPEIASELNVNMIVEGAVQRSGDRVRINIQLIDGETDSHLWAEYYDKKLTTENLFEIQAEITDAIASRLGAVVSVGGGTEDTGTPTENLAAYEAFTKGKLLSRKSTYYEKDLLAAVEHFEEAIALDPEFAAASAEKAHAHLQLGDRHGNERVHFRAAITDLAQAEALAPEAVDTLFAQGFGHYILFDDYDLAIESFDRGIALAPSNTDIMFGKAAALARAERFPESITVMERVAKLDPQNTSAAQRLALVYMATGEFEKAQQHLTHARTIYPDDAELILDCAEVWLVQGDPLGAWNSLTTELEDPFPDFFVKRAYYALYTRDQDIIAQAMSDWPKEYRREEGDEDIYDTSRAVMMFFAGDKEGAAALARDIEARQAADPSRGEDTYFYEFELAALQSDLEAVRAGIQLYQEEYIDEGDALHRAGDYLAIAEALSMVGDPNAAFNYIDRVTDKFGPAIYAKISVLPAFDQVRGHPRYLVLKQEYEEWVAARKP